MFAIAKVTFAALTFIYLSILLIPSNVRAFSDIPTTEFQARRQQTIKLLPDGILLIHARTSFASEDRHGFLQDPSFYYLTGLGRTMSAILAIDGQTRESWLFVPPKLTPLPAADDLSASKLMIEHVVSWDEFASYVEGRISANPKLVIYTDEISVPLSNPPGYAPIADTRLLWQQTLKARWPNVTFRSAATIIEELRLVKSPAEIEVMRRVAKSSAASLLTGLRAIRPGRSQREAEAEVVRECIVSGGEGPSFWPWIMTGPNAVFPKPFESFADYRHLNRVMQKGELVRVDVGCDVAHYKGDVGRTAPVSGRFDPGQREVWEILVNAYRAGLTAIRDGVRREDVFSASLREVEGLRRKVKTQLGKRAVDELLGKDGTKYWYLHGAGLESAEGLPEVLRAGMIVDFEPIFSVEGQGFYLEDMILVTREGNEILTAGLPYSADEIETLIGKKIR